MSEAEALLTWADVVADPSLQNLPYKIELDADGKVVMSPAGKWHAMLQGRIAAAFADKAGGHILAEIAIAVQPAPRTIVADVAWMSDARMAQCPGDGPLPIAPEICVEIKSPSNTEREMADKVRLYVEAGAEEVWVVDLDGNKTVHRK